MFKIESYVTPILLSYVDKYVKDFKPADAQVSLWGGGVALHNLVLKADVLQQEVSLPFTLISGRIHELLIQVPWTKIMSEPIVITIDTIECILSLRPPSPDDSPPPEPSRKPQEVEAPPGYMQALVRRIVSNISLKIHHLIVKYVEDDIVLSLNVKHLTIDSTDAKWVPAFADFDQALPVLRRLVQLDDLTLCLDRTDADGKIRFYQEPVLYRCQLNFRVLTRLASAHTRRATSVSIQLRSSKLAWGLTSDQLTLILRLLRERPTAEFIRRDLTPPNVPSTTNVATSTGAQDAAEGSQKESWSEWAWSWMPTWMDKDGGAEEAPLHPSTPNPIHITACLDHVSLVFKVTEIESGGRKKTRGILDFSAYHAACKALICAPTVLQVCVAARSLELKSHGKCVCGHSDLNTLSDLPTVYLSRLNDEEEKESGTWDWPPEAFEEYVVETAVAIDEEYQEMDYDIPETPVTPSKENDAEASTEESSKEAKEAETPVEEKPVEPTQTPQDLWHKMSPVLFLQFSHDRSPPKADSNPYDNPPKDYEYSDWVENCILKIRVQPLDLQVCMGLIHRLNTIKNIFAELPPAPVKDHQVRTLTIEECESLLDNLPQRRVDVDWRGFRVRFLPWDHSMHEKIFSTPICLHITLPRANVQCAMPLYPLRVCSAACQLPRETGGIWEGARLHLSAIVTSMQVTVVPMTDDKETKTPRPVARADFKFVSHRLLHEELFTNNESVLFSYAVRIKETNLCGSAARLQAAWQVVNSLIERKLSDALRYTTLAEDSISDEESVAVDLTLEDVSVRGYITHNINTHNVAIQSARATIFHKTALSEPKQAWLFSGPDTPTSSAYLRMAAQWCKVQVPDALDYFGVWTEPTAICVDPLFISWLAYKPQMKPMPEPPPPTIPRTISSSQYFHRRRFTPPSSSGRGGSRSGSAAELVHSSRPRSHGSSSEPSDLKDKTPPDPPKQTVRWFESMDLVDLHNRLRHLLFNVDISLLNVYVTLSTASAVDCATVRDAMERHATLTQRVLAFSFGRLTLHCSSIMKYIWQEIRHDGPSFVSPKLQEGDSFPWKLKLVDLSCYTLEVQIGTESAVREKYASGLRSQLRLPCVVTPRTVLELVTTTVTLSIVTKSLPKHHKKPTDMKKHETTPGEERTRYFTTGADFKPSTLREFVRGPSKRKSKKEQAKEEQAAAAASESEKEVGTEHVVTGPLVSLGVHLHADTPPAILRLDQDQVHIMAASLHCLTHIMRLMQREPVVVPRNATTLARDRSLIRSVSEQDEMHSQVSEESPSENRSELLTIYESKAEEVPKLKTFLWFQWVISRATLIVATDQVKLVFNIDDIITTVDLQSHYNQLKIKVASASVKHFERTEAEEWTAAVLGGRVLEIREPSNTSEENHFLCVTITQAQISTLPESWKEELHPKITQTKDGPDTMWEIYMTLAPLEAVLRPTIIEHIMLVLKEMAPRSYCPLRKEPPPKVTNWQWPYCYVAAGGLRLVLYSDGSEDSKDDTFLFMIGKIEVNPHPENPICRRSAGADASWPSPGAGFEGRQYELFVRNVSIQSARFSQIVNQEFSESSLQGTAGENPALKWAQKPESPVLTPVLHTLEINCLYAPPLFAGETLACGSAFELNLTSDCAVEVSLAQLALAHQLIEFCSKAARANEASNTLFDDEKYGMCPYRDLLAKRMSHGPSADDTSINSDDTVSKSLYSSSKTLGLDSGVDTSNSHTTSNTLPKRTASVAFIEDAQNPADYWEVFVTMGVIELSLYTKDNNSPEVVSLRPPASTPAPPRTYTFQLVRNKESVDMKRASEDDADIQGSVKSITENVRNVDVGKRKLRTAATNHARKMEGNLPLLHITLHQPNLYYFKKRTLKNFQASLFNLWLGLGADQLDKHWHMPLLSTSHGVPDPITDIPPALATMKLVANATGTSTTVISSRANLRLEIERPMQLDISNDSLLRLKIISELVKGCFVSEKYRDVCLIKPEIQKSHVLYKLKKIMVTKSIESITVQTTQIGVNGSQGAAGWASASLQVAVGARPERMLCRSLVTAFLVSLGAPGDHRHPLVHPLMLGAELEANWELWRRSEGGFSPREPTIRLGLELDRLVVDFRPEDMVTLVDIRSNLKELSGTTVVENPKDEEVDILLPPTKIQLKSPNIGHTTEASEHYYKDDLRSGAFKIVNGSQLPLAYQVTLHEGCVSWKYPHPRAVTRLVAYPLPDQDLEVDCILEHYCPSMLRWEPHTHFKLPVSDPREVKLQAVPPDAVFAVLWRCRACIACDKKPPPYEFNLLKFQPKAEPLQTEPNFDQYCPQGGCDISAEQLSGALRVDSYFAPKLLPIVRSTVRLGALDLYLHNGLPKLPSQATALEGYYVTKPLMKSHRVLSVTIRDATVHAHHNPIAGQLVLVNMNLASELFECTTAIMDRLIEDFRMQAAITIPDADPEMLRSRLQTGLVRVELHVTKLKTIESLIKDWMAAKQLCDPYGTEQRKWQLIAEREMTKREIYKETAEVLEGRIAMWIHNSSASPLKVGQEGTDELLPLASGARFAYRWGCPESPKRLRFALTGPSTDWKWSSSIPFVAGTFKVRLEEQETGEEVVMHVQVEETGARRSMHLTGKLALASMTRHPFLYKVRSRSKDAKTWNTIATGELLPESVGRTVLCNSDFEMTLKIKLVNHDTGWSGDIPLKECPKENVPWLVKVPSEGEIPYMSVWCRVSRARADGRILATVWPLYVLRSQLPLDTDVLITTETGLSSPDLVSAEARPPPIIQTAPGRGVCTHLYAPGTTAARHSLTFQYRNIECPVTREAVPLHYGVTATSVFDKKTPVNNIEDVMRDIIDWSNRSRLNSESDWPYSIVSRHWHDKWKPALLQPKCDVTVRYSAVRAGGGCSLELQLCPVVLLCNAATIPLTLRAHDAAPLCKLEPGHAIAPPAPILTKPFFMSVEIGRETFVSGQLSIWQSEGGRYGVPPPGQVALDHPRAFAIQCAHKVALLTLYYEIKHDINVMGVSCSYTVLNKLNKNIMVSAVVVPIEIKQHSMFRHSYHVVPPIKKSRMYGTPLCRFTVQGRWRGDDSRELQPFLYISVGSDQSSGGPPVPLRLCSDVADVCRRRAYSLRTDTGLSIPVVVSQVKHEGRWAVSVAKDPCPQFLVENCTDLALAIAQADLANATKGVQAIQECEGVNWYCVIDPDTTLHYSTPTYCDRYPPRSEEKPLDPVLTIATVDDSGEMNWSVPVVATTGEQLLQISGGATIKLHVETHPHTTLLQLKQVHDSDLSASGIRKRIFDSMYIQPTHKDVAGRDSVDSDSIASMAGVSRTQSVGKRRDVALDTLIEQDSSVGLSGLSVLRENDGTAGDKSEVLGNESDNVPNKSDKEKTKTKKEESQTKNTENLTIAFSIFAKDTDKPELVAVQHMDTLVSSGVKEVKINSLDKSEDQDNYDYDVSGGQRSANKIMKDFSSIDPMFQNLKNRMPDGDIPRKSDDDNASASLLLDDASGDNLSFLFYEDKDWEGNVEPPVRELVHLLSAGVTVRLSPAVDAAPPLALTLDRVDFTLGTDSQGTLSTISIADIQIDNLQFETGQFDFEVIASTCISMPEDLTFPPIWNMSGEKSEFGVKQENAHLMLKARHDHWKVLDQNFHELTELEISVGPIALYIEDAYISALMALLNKARPPTDPAHDETILSETRAVEEPIRLRLLLIHPLDVTLTLHTAVRMYIALDQSPLRLSAFKLEEMMTSAERLTHALTVHYLSAALLGVGWVVGGLELLGAPGALAARVGGATGGVRGVAAAAAAGLLRSLSACAGSLARNLDLLAGDEDHARRAQAARRTPPETLVAGLIAGLTNFAINILGAVGGLAHHPLVGVAVGEGGGVAGLRRGIVGAFSKPLSATADLVAYAGSGLLRQAGWSPSVAARAQWQLTVAEAGWRRDCVRWLFRMSEVATIDGFQVLLEEAPLHLLITHKFLVVADPDTERVVEMIDFKFCTLGPYQGQLIELCVTREARRSSIKAEPKTAEEGDEYEMSAAAMARVARYTGTAGGDPRAHRLLTLLPPPGLSHSLYAHLAALLRYNDDTHLRLM